VGDYFKCVRKAIIRTDPRLDSAKSGTLEVGEVIVVLEATLDAGVVRVRFAIPSRTGAKGWVSVKARSGDVLLEPTSGTDQPPQRLPLQRPADSHPVPLQMGDRVVVGPGLTTAWGEERPRGQWRKNLGQGTVAVVTKDDKGQDDLGLERESDNEDLGSGFKAADLVCVTSKPPRPLMGLVEGLLGDVHAAGETLERLGDLPLRVGDRVVVRRGLKEAVNKTLDRWLTSEEVAEVVDDSKGQDNLTLQRVSAEGSLGELLDTPAAGYRAADFELKP
jgi:hypothetical protein